MVFSGKMNQFVLRHDSRTRFVGHIYGDSASISKFVIRMRLRVVRKAK